MIFEQISRAKIGFSVNKCFGKHFSLNPHNSCHMYAVGPKPGFSISERVALTIAPGHTLVITFSCPEVG
jgi:hypothetical protein